MHIILLGAAMPFGPDSLRHRSLGGSETAQLMMGKALAKRGHEVWQLTALPPPGAPDHIADGALGPDGVRYIHARHWQDMITKIPHDLLVISRDIRLAGVPHQARHVAYWAHDLATYQFMAPGLQAHAWNIDEVWAVSNFHADQIAQVTGYPRERIYATRNGIVDVNDDTLFEQINFGVMQAREKNTLFYAARPERGLEALVRPGGIMERLPEFKLRVAMYDNFPEHMRGFYDYIRQRIDALPNVEYIGCLTQPQVRNELASAAAYVYPTSFEETSCILAREAIEQRTPFITTKFGALPETLGDCAVFFEDYMLEGAVQNVARRPLPDWGTDEYCDKFASFIKWTLGECPTAAVARVRMYAACEEREDLYWDTVADDWLTRICIYKSKNLFSTAKSLVEDGDAIAALTMLTENQASLRPHEQQFFDYLKHVYRFVDYDDAMMGAYYEEATKFWSAKYPDAHQSDPVGDHMWYQERHAFVRDRIAQLQLAPGSTVFEYGIAEGNLILNLARAFPDLHFVGCDFDEFALEKARQYAAKHNITNFECYNTLDEQTDELQSGTADVVVCCEVLEHVRYPWKHLDKIEQYGTNGAEVILSTPFGGWEAMQWSHFGHDHFRQHIWEFSQADYEEMIGHKAGLKVAQVSSMPGAMDGRAKGHRCVYYKSDTTPAREINIKRKIAAHNTRETTTACIISANGGKTLANMLDSLWQQVDAVQVALGPCEDNSREIIQRFADRYPWIPVRIIDVPKIAPREFGFDDARNTSIEGISTDWFLWIDSDEYLAGNIRKYTRSNACASYAISQHHFTVEPRGAPAQLDRPARLCRVGMSFYGKVHEHAELEMNKGPGFSFLLPDVDIGHVGYVNELVRRARFERNFPFLVWDREVNPDRNLGAYLWFRDIIHRMRYEHERGNVAGAGALATEALGFYKDKYESIMQFGMGGPTALAYFSEAMAYLGRGREVRMIVSLDGAPVELVGRVDDTSQVLALVDKMLAPELEKCRSKYYR